MSVLTVFSKGTLGTTEIVLDGAAIAPTDLVNFRLYYEPNVQQVGCEFVYLKDGKMVRWSGVNTDDRCDILLDVEEDDVRYRVVSQGLDVKVLASVPAFPDAPGLPILPGCTLVVDVVADGWALNMNKYHQKIAKPLFNVREVQQ